jgi:hypothetical protein
MARESASLRERHRAIAVDPVAERKGRRVRSEAAHVADSAGSWNHGRVEDVFAFSAKDLARVE